MTGSLTHARWSENFTEVVAAIGTIQQLVPFVDKSAKIEMERATGNTKERYAPFEDVVDAIRPHCLALGLVWTQDGREGHAGSFWLDTTIFHPASAQWKVSTIPITTPKPGFREVGAAFSYYRRIGLLAAFGIVAKGEDPDPGEAKAIATARPPRMEPAARPAMAPADADKIIDEAIKNLATSATLAQVDEVAKMLSDGAGGTIVPAKRKADVKKRFDERRAQLRMGETQCTGTGDAR